MKKNCITIGKDSESINEDAVISQSNIIAVSDGAGGGGLFAEKWSKYLLENLPGTPIMSADELDRWIEGVWEPYYNQCENDAKSIGGMALDKFYDEGSFATLAAAWKVSATQCRWISIGDSVVFHYNQGTGLLEHSYGELSDFDNPPFLLNCKDELNKEGVRTGSFSTNDESIIFAASDALAHYLLMMYEISHQSEYEKEIADAIERHTKNENYIRASQVIAPFDFYDYVLSKLLNTVNHEANFRRHISSLISRGLLTYDDYSFAVMPM
jgi:hypothetical protein